VEWSGRESCKPLLPISLSLLKVSSCVPEGLQGRFIPLGQVIGISLLKGKCNSKEREKDFSKIIVLQKKGTFFGKEVLRKCAKSHAKRKCRRKGNYAKLMPIISKEVFMKHSCMA
jgi:hypothetical protein